MRKWKSQIAGILTICMVLAMMPSVVFADTAQEKYNYVSIGASNVNGYGLRGYIPASDKYTADEIIEAAALDPSIKANANVLGYMQAPEDCYPSLVKKELEKRYGSGNVNLNQLAISSMRAEELRILLDNNYNGDAYSAWRFVGKGNWFDIADGTADGDISQLRSQYQESVKNADLITVDIGVNNFGVYLSYQLGSNYALDSDLSLIDKKLGKHYTRLKKVAKAIISSIKPDLQIDEYTKLLDSVTYALVGYCYNFDKCMERIFELNPDANVIVVSIQNLLSGMKLNIDGSVIPFGDIMGGLINAANIYIADGSHYTISYYCADVRKHGRVEFFLDDIAAYNGDVSTLSNNIIDCFNVYDGNPGASYDSNFHVKYLVHKAFSEKKKKPSKKDYEAAYAIYAEMMHQSALWDTINLEALSGNRNAEKALEQAVKSEIIAAAKNHEHKLPEDFFAQVAKTAGVDESLVRSLAAVNVRISVGNSFFAHPNPDGHIQIKDAIIKTLDNKNKGRRILKKEFDASLVRLFNKYMK